MADIFWLTFPFSPLLATPLLYALGLISRRWALVQWLPVTIATVAIYADAARSHDAQAGLIFLFWPIYAGAFIALTWSVGFVVATVRRSNRIVAQTVDHASR